MWAFEVSDCSSGTTPPANGLFYNTSDNSIKDYYNGAIDSSGYSFPIAKVTVSGGAITSIDQVFNGFGYIGSTVFVLPGVKGLIPDGRNADGTLNNEEISITAVKTVTPTTSLNIDKVSIILEGNGISYNGGYRYDEESNLTFHDTTLRPCCLIGSCTLTNSVISNFRTKQVFHALDHNDTDFVAHNAMPSNNYTDLTLGASGTNYTAPADGWFFIHKAGDGSGQYLTVMNRGINDVEIFELISYDITGGMQLTCLMPAKKGDIVRIGYSLGGQTYSFRFIYAQGAQ
jgi:hypothetical protein